MASTRPRLGELLISRGLLSESQLAVALAEQRESRERLGSILIRRRLVGEVELLQALADSLNVPYVDLDDFVIDPEAAKLLPEADCRRLMALPISTEASRLVVAMGDPSDLFTLDDIRHITGWRLTPVLAEGAKLLASIDQVWGRTTVPPPASSASAESPGAVRVTPAVSASTAAQVHSVTSPEVLTFVEQLLTRAVEHRASEIHLDPLPGELRARFRVDGTLHDAVVVPTLLRDAVLARLKILGELDLGQRRLPQEGWIALESSGRRIDIRIVTLPTTEGEAVTLRIRDADREILRVDQLGLSEINQVKLARAVDRGSGAVLVSGPLGSGRSTTLYATLASLAGTDRHILTVEDRLEYRMAGVRQIQVNPDGGLSYPHALRAALPAAPDVILVGEIDDPDTAKLVCEGGGMGRLVLGGMHASDTTTALLRLRDMGVEPYLITAAVTCVIGQRLVRRLCEHCKQVDQTPDLGVQLPSPESALGFARPVGCAECSQTGYKGRIALHEVLSMSEELGRQLAIGASSSELRITAVQQGMGSLLEDGMEKAARGLTSLDELRRLSG